MKLGCYKIYEDSTLPTFGTKQSACFDIYSYLPNNELLTAYTIQNEKIKIPCCSYEEDKETKYFEIFPGIRALIPTGLIFNIPKGHSIRIHARSGLAFKEGLVLANSEGIIDQDYIDPCYIMLTNISTERIKIKHGQRIAQGELVKTLDYSIEVCYTKPFIEGSTRIGGFGSTGLT